MRAYIDSVALNTALEMGLFWLLAEGPLTVEQVAEAVAIPTHRSGPWLELLTDMGYLDRTGNRYTPSDATHAAILSAFSRESWAHLAEEERERYVFGVDLSRHIGHPLSVWAGQNRLPHDYLKEIADDPAFARRFTNMLYELHKPLAEAIAEKLNMDGVSRLMDLGGGSGVISLALLQRYPTLSAVVVDHSHVCEAGRAIAGTMPEGGRIAYLAADFLRDNLPIECDLALECDVGVYEETFFRKVWQALKPGGRLVIVDEFDLPTHAPARPFRRYKFYQSMNCYSRRSDHYSIVRVQSLLAHAGFQLSVEQHLVDRMFMLQGQK